MRRRAGTGTGTAGSDRRAYLLRGADGHGAVVQGQVARRDGGGSDGASRWEMGMRRQ